MVTSLITTTLDFGVLTILVELFRVHYVVATVAGTIVGASSNFLINRQWSFDDHTGGVRWQVVRFLPVQAGSSGLQALFMWILVDKFHRQYLMAKVIVAVSVYMLWNYPMNRYFVFPRDHDDVKRPAALETRAR